MSKRSPFAIAMLISVAIIVVFGAMSKPDKPTDKSANASVQPISTSSGQAPAAVSSVNFHDAEKDVLDHADAWEYSVSTGSLNDPSTAKVAQVNSLDGVSSLIIRKQGGRTDILINFGQLMNYNIRTIENSYEYGTENVSIIKASFIDVDQKVIATKVFTTGISTNHKALFIKDTGTFMKLIKKSAMVNIDAEALDNNVLSTRMIVSHFSEASLDKAKNASD